MKKQPKLCLVERLNIKILLDKGYSLRKLAKVMNRSPNTVSYEIKVNGGLLEYNPNNAHQYARTRKKDTKREWSKIQKNDLLRNYIITGLESKWNPDEISGRMRLERQPFYASKTAIYDWLHSTHGARYCKLLYSGRYNKKKQTKKTERVMIPNRVGIQERSAGITNRSRYGHFENDTIVSRKGCQGGLSVALERRSRLLVATKVSSMSTLEHMQVILKHQELYKTLSHTMDNGIENKHWKVLGVPTYFCDPYSSWQKGSVENVNKMIRQYFPKGTNFREVSQRRVDQVVSIINNKPRKILKYKTAMEVAALAGILINIRKGS
jgi:transposase, IS30 family